MMLPRRATIESRISLDPAIVNVFAISVLLVIGWLDYITGYEFGFFIFYFIPVSIAAWSNGERAGLAIACMSAACWFLSDRLSNHPYSKAYFIYWEMFMRWVSFLTTAITIARIRKMLQREARLNGELRRALSEVDELKARVRCSESCDRFRHYFGEQNRPEYGSENEPAVETVIVE